MTHIKELVQVRDNIELTVDPMLNTMDERNRAFVAICQILLLLSFVICSIEAVTPDRNVDIPIRI